jgi:hypothetical protein
MAWKTRTERRDGERRFGKGCRGGPYLLRALGECGYEIELHHFPDREPPRTPGWQRDTLSSRVAALRHLGSTCAQNPRVEANARC